MYIFLSLVFLYSATDSSAFNPVLWRNTLLLSIICITWYWLRKRQVPGQITILFTILCIISSTAITQLALAAQNTISIHSLPDLSLLYLFFHYALVIWLILCDLLPAIFHVSAIWAMLFLYSSYLYFHTFIALELGALFPILFALIVGYLLLRPKILTSITQKFQIPVRNSLIVFLLLTGLATIFSEAPGESLSQYIQIACFAILPFILAYDLVDAETWRVVAVWVVVLGGLIFALLAGVKFGLLTYELGFASALHYRLFIADIGPNWISRPLVILLPLSISIMLTASNRQRKLLWLVGILGMLLTIAYTQSATGYSGWMALLLGVGVLVLLLQWPDIRGGWLNHTGGRLFVAVSSAVMIVAVILITGRIAARVNSYSFYSRLYGWRALLLQVADHPVFGSGLGVRHVAAQYGDLIGGEYLGTLFPYYSLTQAAQRLQLSLHAHNLLLELAVGAGIPAMLAFLWFLWELAKHSVEKFYQATSQSRILIAGCIGGVVASLAWGLIDVMEYSPPFFSFPIWAIIGLLLADPKIFGIKEKNSSNNKDSVFLRNPLSFYSRYKSSIPSHVSQFFLISIGVILVFGVIFMPLIGNLHYQAGYTAFQDHQMEIAASELETASKWEPLNAKYHQMRGESLINLGKYDEAVSAYERALFLKKDYAPYHNQLGWLYWLLGDLDRATTHFQEAVEVDPREAWQDGLSADLGLIYFAQGKFDEAVPLFGKTIMFDPRMTLAPYWLRVNRSDRDFDVELDPVYASLGNLDSSQNEFDELNSRIFVHLNKSDSTPRLFDIDIEAESSFSLSTVLDHIEEEYAYARSAGSQEAPQLLATVADAAHLAGYYDRAEQTYMAFQVSYPERSFGYGGLGKLYQELGRLDEAQKMLEKALEISPRDTNLWFTLIEVNSARGQWKEANEALESLSKFTPFNSKLYVLKSKFYQEQADLIQATEAMRKSLFIQASIPNRLILANQYKQLGQPELATNQCLTAAEELLRTWPRPYDPQLWEIGSCLAESNADEIQKEITILVEDHPLTGNVLLGHYYRSRGQFGEALNAYHAAADARPDQGAPHYFLGETYQALLQPESAEIEYQMAAQQEPFESLPLVALGKLNWQQGQPDFAYEALSSAVEATPGWGKVHIALGNLLLASGDLDSAAHHYQQAQFVDGNLREDQVYDFISHLVDAETESPGQGYVRNDYFIISGEQHRVLFTHPDSRAQFTLDIPEEAVLTFNIAISPEVWEQPGDGVLFTVYVNAEDSLRKIFSVYIDPKNNQFDRRWHPYRVDLGEYAGGEVSIIFETGTGPAGDYRYDWAGWGDLRLLVPQR